MTSMPQSAVQCNALLFTSVPKNNYHMVKCNAFQCASAVQCTGALQCGASVDSSKVHCIVLYLEEGCSLHCSNGRCWVCYVCN